MNFRKLQDWLLGIRLNVLLILIIVAAIIWRPFIIDFFHDDWATINIATQENSYIWRQFTSSLQFGNRPLGFAFMYLFIFLFGSHAYLWQMLMVVLYIAIAFLLWRLPSELAEEGQESSLASFWAVVLFLLFPAAAHYTTWDSCYWPLISIVFTLIAFLGIVRSVNSGRFSFWPAFFFFLAINTYEQVFLIYLPFSLLIFAHKYRKTNTLRVLGGHILAFTFAQSAVLIAVLGGVKHDDPKQVTAKMASLGDQFVTKMIALSIEVARQVYRSARVPEIFITAACLIFLALIVWMKKTETNQNERLTIIGIGISLVSGILLGIGILVFANYELIFSGTHARTVAILHFWLAIGGASLLIMMPKKSMQFSRFAVLLVFAPILGKSAIEHTRVIKSYEIQQEMLMAMTKIKWADRVDSSTVILVETKSDLIEPFTAFWDISGALSVNNSEIRRIYGVRNDFAYTSRYGVFSTRFTNGVFAQTSCGTGQILWSLKTRRVVLVNLERQKLTEFPDGGNIPCHTETRP